MSEVSKTNSAMIKVYMKEEFNSVLKGKNPAKLIQILENYELDPLCEKINEEQIFYFIVAYIINEDYISLQHFCDRYTIDTFYPSISQIARNGANQNLKEYSDLFKKFVQARKQQIPQIKEILSEAMLKYILNVHSKYYMNVSLKNIQSFSPLFTVQTINRLGYKVEQNFVQLSQAKSSNHKYPDQQKILMQKMKQIIMVAQKMTAYQ